MSLQYDTSAATENHHGEECCLLCDHPNGTPVPPESNVGENEQQLALEDPPTAVVERSKEGVSKGGASTIQACEL